MEEHPHQQQSTSPAPVGTSSKPHQKRGTSSFKLHRLLDFVQTYPLLVWGGIWVSILLVAAIAVGGLLSPGLTSGRRATGAAFGSSAIGETEVASGSGRATFWIFGAIALTCTAGSILVSKRLSRPPLSHHKLSRPKRAKPYVAKAATAKAPAKPKMRRPHPPRPHPAPPVGRSTHPKRLRPFSPSDLPPLPAPAIPATTTSTPLPQQTPHPVSFAIGTTAIGSVPVAPPVHRPPAAPVGVQPLVPGAIAPPGQQPPARKQVSPPPQTVVRQAVPKPQPPTRPKPVAQATVTVVPPEENHPLDWQESSIADLMDIRKRHSLSSWL